MRKLRHLELPALQAFNAAPSIQASALPPPNALCLIAGLFPCAQRSAHL
jgi:hypothetical protein